MYYRGLLEGSQSNTGYARHVVDPRSPVRLYDLFRRVKYTEEIPPILGSH